jgi:hypothetical protein
MRSRKGERQSGCPHTVTPKLGEPCRDGARAAEHPPPSAAGLGRRQGGNVPAAQIVTDAGTLELIPEDTEILCKAADMLLSGSSVQAMVRFLNDSRLRPRKKKSESGLLAEDAARPSSERWSPRTAKRLLMGPFAPAILSIERAENVAGGSKRTVQECNRNPTRLMSSVARCDSCKGPMYTGRSNNGKAIYRCVSRSHGGECSKPQPIPADPFDAFMEQWWLSKWASYPEEVVTLLSDERTARHC